MKNESKLAGVDPVLIEFAKKLDAVVPVMVIFGFRSIKEQDDLYAQGRTKPGNKVTNAKGGSSPHNYNAAIDMAPTPLDWNDIAAFDKMVAAARKIIKDNKYDITCGADFSNVDRPHFELTKWRDRRKP